MRTTCVRRSQLTHKVCAVWLAAKVLPGNSDIVGWVTLYGELLKEPRSQLSRNQQVFSDEMANARMEWLQYPGPKVGTSQFRTLLLSLIWASQQLNRARHAATQTADNKTAKYQELEKTYTIFLVTIGLCSQQAIELHDAGDRETHLGRYWV